MRITVKYMLRPVAHCKEGCSIGPWARRKKGPLVRIIWTPPTGDLGKAPRLSRTWGLDLSSVMSIYRKVCET